MPKILSLSAFSIVNFRTCEKAYNNFSKKLQIGIIMELSFVIFETAPFYTFIVVIEMSTIIICIEDSIAK
jgi:hypothetical protein